MYENKVSTQFLLNRSHAGKVHDVAKAAFGENVQITPAGGAGFKVLKSFDINSINDSLFSKLM